MKKRITELDSLRGLAALTVIFGHILNTLPPLPKWLMYSPFRILWAGHEAVILFFILSGFVLTLPFLKRKKLNYVGFLLKRVLRIYLPYIVAILFALILKQIFFTTSADRVQWADIFWNIDINFENLIGHMLLVTDFNTDAINPVVWSLVHEMRISIIFPFIMMIILRISWKKSLILAALFSVLGASINVLDIDLSRGYLSSYAHSIHYISMFILGALAAIYQEQVVSKFKSLSTIVRSSVFLLGIFLYTLQIGMGYFIHEETLMFIREWVIASGALIFIAISLSSRRISSLLTKRPAEFFGKISYSLYLYHLPVLFASMYFFKGIGVKWAVIPTFLIITLIISTLSWKYIENISTKLGRIVSERIVKKKVSLQESIQLKNS